MPAAVVGPGEAVAVATGAVAPPRANRPAVRAFRELLGGPETVAALGRLVLRP